MKRFIECLVAGEKSPRYFEVCGNYRLAGGVLQFDDAFVTLVNLVYCRLMDEGEYEDVFGKGIVDQNYG